MNGYLMLGCTTLLPAVVSVLLLRPKVNARFEKTEPLRRSVSYGVIYGLLTGLIVVLSTVPLFGSGGNLSLVVDAPSIVAGLLFDFPAGLVAAAIGGAFRYASVLWAGKSLMLVPCAFGVLLSGALATVVRKSFFNEHYKPNFIHAVFFAVLIEIFCYSLIFLFNLNHLYEVFSTLQEVFLPGMLCMIVSVGLPVLLVRKIDHEPVFLKPPLLVRSFEKYMLLFILFDGILMLCFSAFISGKISVESYNSLLSSCISDLQSDTESALDQDLMDSTRLLAKDFLLYSSDLRALADKYDVSEINIIKDDIIVQSTGTVSVYFDMRSSEQSDDFMRNVLEDGEYVQAFRPMGQFSDVSKKYAGAVLDAHTVLQAGYDTGRFQEGIREHIDQAVRFRHIGTNGEFVVYNAKGELIASRAESAAYHDAFFEEISKNTVPMMQLRQSKAEGEDYTWMYNESNGFYIFAVIPSSEVMFSQDLTTYTSLFIGIILFALVFALIYYLLRRLVIEELGQVNEGLGKVTGGDLDTVIDVRNTKEFIELSDDINLMVSSLKGFIRDAEKRYEKELDYARIIQKSVLPGYHHFCDNRKDIQLYASMTPAEDVGGDFYDFYTVGDNRLAFCIADVSGKSIPAAMFMMRVKTLLRSTMEKYDDLKIAFEETNRQICESNEAGLFVTVWMGVCDMRKGQLQFVNAGHNPPLLCRYGESFEYLKTRPNLVVGGMARTKYQVHTVDIQPGDRIYLYTDGVTEAKNSGRGMYGEKRLLEVLNRDMSREVEELPSIEDNCTAVSSTLSEFVGGEKQFDDITMLGISFIFLQDGDHAQFSGVKESVRYSGNFLNECNENHRIPAKTARHIMICSDEIMSNIIMHGHAKKVHIDYRIDNNAVLLEFTDNGILYDPLKAEDPDVTLPASKRKIGGLGLLMIKKIASSVEYAEKDGWNDLKLRFEFQINA